MKTVDGLRTFYNGIEEDIPLNKERRRSRYANYTRVVWLVPQYRISLFNESEDVTLNCLKYVDILFNIYLKIRLLYAIFKHTSGPHPEYLSQVVVRFDKVIGTATSLDERLN